MIDTNDRGSGRRVTSSRIASVLSYALLTAMAAVGAGGLTRLAAQSTPACGLANPAFCDTFEQGPAPARGRGGDLDPTMWSAARLAPQDFSGGGPVANPAPIAPIPPCRANLPLTEAYPPNDTLICDATPTRSKQLMTAVVMQNYGMNSYMIKQPFDFAGRVGKIVFDVDAVSLNWLGGFLSIDITEDPTPATTFNEFGNFEHGPVPRNGLVLKWSDNCLTSGTQITLGKTMVYTNYDGRIIEPSFVAGPFTTPGCVTTRQNFLNHFEIRLSQQRLEIYGSDYSPDDGRTFPNLHLLYSADVNLPFTRGYVHLTARNHASKKYGYGPDWVYHWDNVGFDGPILTNARTYEIPDNNTMSTYPPGSGTTIMNLGYQLLDGTTGKPAGIYDPVRSIGPLAFQGVNVTGASAAALTMNAYFNAITHTPSTAWGVRYRFNGGAWRDRLLTAREVQAIAVPDTDGNVALQIDVPPSDLRSGTNTLDLLPVSAPMDYPPTIANINLVVKDATSTSPPASPSNLRIIRAMLSSPPMLLRGVIATSLWPESPRGRP
jgi:hypothetical protein